MVGSEHRAVTASTHDGCMPHRLAATLGAKSSFKKLPKRDVLTADIAGLCKAIKDPLEPLALRLSSNLMVGVVRYAPSDRYLVSLSDYA
jgi:hypothetical protein